jgi:hypothetical protein
MQFKAIAIAAVLAAAGSAFAGTVVRTDTTTVKTSPTGLTKHHVHKVKHHRVHLARGHHVTHVAVLHHKPAHHHRVVAS